MNFTEHLRDWIQDRPLISVRALESAAGMPLTALHLALKGKRDIPATYWFPICYILAPYGLKINGWEIYTDPDEPTVVYAQKRTRTISEPHDDSVEYQEAYIRDVLDESDLVSWMREIENE